MSNKSHKWLVRKLLLSSLYWYILYWGWVELLSHYLLFSEKIGENELLEHQSISIHYPALPSVTYGWKPLVELFKTDYYTIEYS